MTQTTELRGHQGAYDRDAILGIHSLGEFVLDVPDLAEAGRFYSLFGLRVVTEGAHLALYCHDHPHRWAQLRKGPRKRLHHLEFLCYAADLPRFRTRLAEAGIALVAAPDGFADDGLWFHNFEGLPIHIKAGAKTMPDQISPIDCQPTPPGVQGAALRRTAPRVYPVRLSHVLTFTSDVSRAIDFYERILGLRLSDRSGNAVAFLHGAHGSDHHLLALAGAGGPGFHHVAWDVPTIDDVGLGAQYMADNGYGEGWGFGRHVLGSNYFHYIRDPWGSFSEYSCGIDYVPAGFEWAARDNAPEDSLHLYGPPVPEWFIRNYELEDTPA